MPLPGKSYIIAALFTFIVLTFGTTLIAYQEELAEVPFLYPDPRTVGVHPYVMQPKQPGAVTPDRYAGVSEQERLERLRWELFLREVEGLPGFEQAQCPLCVDDPKTPCGTCRMCEQGYPCEKTLCRHCIQPRSKNMMSSCDLAAGDEPCGTCDSCREHRSDPCEHADSGYGPKGEYNPYHEPRHLSVIPRPILDVHNNGARKFPVYYNPAPAYRTNWNPSMLQAYARPYTFRYTCALCYRDSCGCNAPGLAGQVSYVYACKFCNRNPCACAAEICDVNKDQDPRGITEGLALLQAEREGTGSQPVEILDTPPTISDTAPSEVSPSEWGNGLFDDSPAPTQSGSPSALPRPSLGTP